MFVLNYKKENIVHETTCVASETNWEKLHQVWREKFEVKTLEIDHQFSNSSTNMYMIFQGKVVHVHVF